MSDNDDPWPGLRHLLASKRGAGGDSENLVKVLQDNKGVWILCGGGVVSFLNIPPMPCAGLCGAEETAWGVGEWGALKSCHGPTSWSMGFMTWVLGTPGLDGHEVPPAPVPGLHICRDLSGWIGMLCRPCRCVDRVPCGQCAMYTLSLCRQAAVWTGFVSAAAHL